MPTGRKPKNYVEMKTSIPPEMNDALDSFVSWTGVAKASLIRVALANELVRLGLLPSHPPIPLAVTTRESTPTTGRS